ncbi:MAG: hypothetical protein AAGK04_01260 [Planctomycetota bacterium]
MNATPPIRLRDLPGMARVGVAALVLTLLGGLAASGAYLYMHQEQRDERNGWSIDDVKSHYHGLTTRAPLLVSLDSGHPETLPGTEREILTDWLTGDRVSQDYDDLDLGDDAPAELIAIYCLDCHARSSTGDESAPDIALEFWDDIRSLAESRNIQPIDGEILAASTHTHALALVTLSLTMALLAWFTAFPRALIGVLVAATGIGLLTDIGSWWLTRWNDQFAYAIVVGGFIYNASTVLLGLVVLAELARPRVRAIDPASTEA